MVKKQAEPQITPSVQDELIKQVNILLNSRKEAAGAYKSNMQNLIGSVDTLFKIDDSLLNLFIKSRQE